jgi:hypothetical protein
MELVAGEDIGRILKHDGLMPAAGSASMIVQIVQLALRGPRRRASCTATSSPRT